MSDLGETVGAFIGLLLTLFFVAIAAVAATWPLWISIAALVYIFS